MPKRFWRASHLGFNFEVGSPLRVEDWLAEWIKKAPDRDAIWDSVCILWIIWCVRNEVMYRGAQWSVSEALSRFLALRSSLKDSDMGRNGDFSILLGTDCNQRKPIKESETSFPFMRGDFVDGASQRLVFATDGAWLAESLRGAYAWVLLDQNGNILQQEARQVTAQSAAMVEILAGIKAMEWAYAQGCFGDSHSYRLLGFRQEHATSRKCLSFASTFVSRFSLFVFKVFVC